MRNFHNATHLDILKTQRQIPSRKLELIGLDHTNSNNSGNGGSLQTASDE